MSNYFCDAYQAITNIVVADGVGVLASEAFANCRKLQAVTIPESVTRIEDRVFSDCNSLQEIAFRGDAPDIVGENIFAATRRSLVVTVPDNSIGWDGGLTTNLPSAWSDRAIAVTTSANPGGGSVAPSSEDWRYVLSNNAEDRAIANVTIDGDTALDEFVLRDGKVYDSVLYVVNRGVSPARLIMPSGHTYVTVGGLVPLSMPAVSTNLVTITRVAADTFLVTRQNLEAVK
jgi:hypothetical protein